MKSRVPRTCVSDIRCQTTGYEFPLGRWDFVFLLFKGGFLFVMSFMSVEINLITYINYHTIIFMEQLCIPFYYIKFVILVLILSGTIETVCFLLPSVRGGARVFHRSDRTTHHVKEWNDVQKVYQGISMCTNRNITVPILRRK